MNKVRVSTNDPIRRRVSVEEGGAKTFFRQWRITEAHCDINEGCLSCESCKPSSIESKNKSVSSEQNLMPCHAGDAV